MNKLLVGALIVVTLALLATITGSYWLYARARMAQDMAMAAQMQAMEAADRAREAGAKSQPQEITVEIGDSLELVESYGRVRLPEPAVVQSDGKALIPDLGWVDVVGLTREQVEQQLRKGLGLFYEDLNLFVIVHKPGSAQPRCLKAPVTSFTSVMFGAF